MPAVYCCLPSAPFKVVPCPALPLLSCPHMLLQLHALGVSRDHFSHIMFDEAGQAGEHAMQTMLLELEVSEVHQ